MIMVLCVERLVCLVSNYCSMCEEQEWVNGAGLCGDCWGTVNWFSNGRF